MLLLSRVHILDPRKIFWYEVMKLHNSTCAAWRLIFIAFLKRTANEINGIADATLSELGDQGSTY